MEQITSNDPSNTSPPKKTKLHQEEKLSLSDATSNHAALSAANLNPANVGHSQQPSNIVNAENHHQSINGIFNFILPSQEDSARASGENLDPNSAGLTNSRTGGVWNRSREEAHSAHVQERSLLGHLITSEETQKKILEADIFRILESEGVTEIGALYKVSPSKFVLVFGSQAAKEKLQNTEIQCRFGDHDLRLSFHKRVGPLRNGREPIFVTIFLPEFISDQAVRLAFSNFGEVVAVFKGRHKFNTDVRNGKRHVKIFPAGEDPAILPRKITFHGRIQRDVLFAEKVVSCYRCKTRHMLGENCPVATPTTEDSNMSLVEQSDAAIEGAAPVQQESSVENQPSADSQQTPSPIQEEAVEGDSSMEDGSGSGSDSGSSSESSDENEPGLESSAGPVAPLEGSPDLPSRENLSVVQGAQANQQQGSQKQRTDTPSEEEKTTTKPTQMSINMRTLKSLIYFDEQEVFPKWYRNRETSVLREALKTLGIKTNFEGFVEVAHAAADLIYASRFGESQYKYRLQKHYDRYCTDNPNGPRLTIEKFDDYLYRWAKKVWPCALDIVFKRVAYPPET